MLCKPTGVGGFSNWFVPTKAPPIPGFCTKIRQSSGTASRESSNERQHLGGVECPTRVLVPLGQRLEPDLPESAVLDALGISQEELLILESDRAQVVACQALQPLTRAGLRLLAGCK